MAHSSPPLASVCGSGKVVVIAPEYLRHRVAGLVKNQDLSRYILQRPVSEARIKNDALILNE